MILIGRYLSPFVRRVGATLHHFGMEFEHRPIRAGGADQDEIRKSNPTGRVPVLILDDGEILADSAVIVDYLDYLAYVSSASPNAGGHLLSGMQAIYPETSGCLPEAWRSLTG